MKALRFSRNLPRYAAARIAGSFVGGAGSGPGPLSLVDTDAPDLPGPDWVRVRPRLAGICGSDLATVDGRSSRYFEPIVSFPFVPGHEVVADLDDGSRVVIEPVLGCATRNISPPCDACARGDLGNCERIHHGDLEPGLQTGYCCDTGGGWSTHMVAHPSQLHAVPDDLDDAAAVMVEPTACAVHAALQARVPPGGTVAVLGAGTLGLLTIAALRRHSDAGTIVAAARYPEQRNLASLLGADVVIGPDEWRRGIRRITGSHAVGDGSIERLTGGADGLYGMAVWPVLGLFEFDLPKKLTDAINQPTRVWPIQETKMHLEGFAFVPDKPNQLWHSQGKQVDLYELKGLPVKQN